MNWSKQPNQGTRTPNDSCVDSSAMEGFIQDPNLDNGADAALRMAGSVPDNIAKYDESPKKAAFSALAFMLAAGMGSVAPSPASRASGS